MSQEKPVTAFLLSLIGGIIILLAGIVSSIWFLYGSAAMGNFGELWFGMMGGYNSMMGSFGVPLGYMTSFSLLGLVAGIIVITSAVMLNMRPQERSAWSILILIFSAISFLNMGGFFIGGILGLIGGAFAFGWKN